MATTAGSLSTPLPPHADTLARSILDRVAATPDKLAFLSPGPDDSWNVKYTWREAGDEMMKLGAGLMALGLDVEDRVAIASNTRTEWIFADGAVMLAGGANTTIYPSTGDDDFGYIVSDSGSRFLIAEDQKQADKALHQRDQLPELTKIILIDGEGDGDFVISWSQLRDLGVQKLTEDPKAIEDRVAQLTPESLATMIYTSGTTGRPKGVELPHRCWVFEGASIQAMHVFEDRRHAFPVAAAVARVRQGADLGAVPDRLHDRHRRSRAEDRSRTCRRCSPTSWPACRASSRRSTRVRTPGPRPPVGPRPRSSRGRSARRRRSRPSSVRASRPVPSPGIQMAIADKLVFSKIRELTGGEHPGPRAPGPRRSTATSPAGSTRLACRSSRATA